MTEPTVATPADEHERRLEWARLIARESVKRWALRSLGAEAAILATLVLGCCSSIVPVRANTPHAVLEVIWYGIFLFVCLAAVFACVTAAGVGVLTIRDWSLLDWRHKAVGVAPWMIVSGVCLLLLPDLMA